MRLLLAVIGLMVFQTVYAQLTIQPILKNTDLRARTSQESATLSVARNTLPFWDDFSITPDGSPEAIRVWGNDTTGQWNTEASKDVFVNATLAINPPSYRVVTFDGLDGNGQFHTGTDRLADQLMSDTMDLSGFNEQDDLFLSFYWQAGGNVERPDIGDSLILQFYNVSADTENGTPWNTVWSIDGGDAPNNHTFYQETIRLEQRFITDKALFRFRSFGQQNGPFDSWHLDWIYLNENRADDDFFYQDVSVNSDISILFSPFRAIPLNQLDIQRFSTPITTSAMNLNDEPDRIGITTNYRLTIRDTESQSTVFSSVTDVEDLFEFFNPDPLIITAIGNITYENVSFSDLNSSDSVVLEAQISIDTTNIRFLDNTPVNLRVNDTTRTQYLLQDFYAFDDGTAEFAVGANTRGAQAGVQFWVEQQDTLTQIDIHFPNIAPESNGKSITLKVYRSLDDDPIYSESVLVTTAQQINQFSPYVLSRPVIVSDTFFIAYEQNVNEYIGIGFDRSNIEASRYIFENIGDGWIRNNRLQGALMIRPVFKNVTDFTLGTDLAAREIMIYPNPTSGWITIPSPYDRIEVCDLSGKLLIQQPSQVRHDLSHLGSGLYLLTVYEKSKATTRKIVIR